MAELRVESGTGLPVCLNPASEGINHPAGAAGERNGRVVRDAGQDGGATVRLCGAGRSKQGHR